MNEWSSEEMRRLQDEAKQRVLEMRSRSKFAAEEMNRSIGENPSAADARFIKAPEVPRAIKMPVELPERKRPDAKTVPPEEPNETFRSHSDAKGSTKKERKESAPSALIKNIFGDLSDDDLERMFVLSLCLLLSYERTDDEILLALMYILS